MKRHVLVVAASLLTSAAVWADTSDVSASGFLVTHRLEVKAAPKQVFEAIGRVDKWWNAEHSYSGNAANLSLELRAGGCFCERWDGGSVQHAQVVYVSKDAVVRLLGGLGPLQQRAVNGVLTFAVATVESKTVLTVTYRVAGSPDVGLEKSAGPVDHVIGEAATRLVAFVESGKP